MPNEVMRRAEAAEREAWQLSEECDTTEQLMEIRFQDWKANGETIVQFSEFGKPAGLFVGTSEKKKRLFL